jgi:hypothetical protein
MAEGKWIRGKMAEGKVDEGKLARGNCPAPEVPIWYLKYQEGGDTGESGNCQTQTKHSREPWSVYHCSNADTWDYKD